jgi:cytochrome c biogenesis protein CcmG, thiol:disulfide interchange protein DsbE
MTSFVFNIRKIPVNTGTALYILLLLTGINSRILAQGKVHDFTLRNTENRAIHYSELRGEKLTVIDFWATWCQPCIRSLPKLVELSKEYSVEGVNFIGISIDGPRNQSKVKPFASSLGISYPILMDSSGELMGELNITSVPTLLVVDRNDRIVYMHEGFTAGDEETIREELDRHLQSNKD